MSEEYRTKAQKLNTEAEYVTLFDKAIRMPLRQMAKAYDGLNVDVRVCLLI